MDKKEYTYFDSSNVEHCVEISKEDFTPKQQDKSIHDQKFKTKPTTFFKDALKRFAKNKSSVAGAIILGTLLVLSVLIPIVDFSDVDSDHPQELKLEPKLFDAGTGFWDGTKRLTDIPCDTSLSYTDENGNVYYYPSASEYPTRAVSNLSLPRENNEINSASPLVTGGYVNIICDKEVYTNDMEDRMDYKATYSSATYNFNINETYGVEVVFYEGEPEEYTLGNYRIYLSYTIEGYEDTTFETVLRDFDEDDIDIDYSTYKNEDLMAEVKSSLAALKEEEDSPLDTDFDPETATLKNVQLYFDVLPIKDDVADLLIKTVTFTTESTSSKEQDMMETISISEANKTLLLGVSDAGYWKSNNATVSLYHGTSYVCDFTFDTYEAVYGNVEEVVPVTDFSDYVTNGWISAVPDFESASASATPNDYFEAVKNENTDSYCPVISINKVTKTSVVGIVTYTVTCTVSKYKILGYTSMPRFLWGTDNKGKDLLKITFIGLRNSLGLGLLTFAICFSFGLIWGSICGYFGGTVDLLLERFTDLLSGIPWIVIMTLCILNLGSNFGTFVLAMCLTGWIGTAAITRTQFYRFRDREYTLACRTLGAGNSRLIFRHILPNAMGTIITSSVLMIPSVIFTEATISYLGLGFKDMQSLGVILSDNQQYLTTYPYLILFPSILMALIMISFNLFGNGLRDAFNPSLKGSE